jgi:hypothetical protein
MKRDIHNLEQWIGDLQQDKVSCWLTVIAVVLVTVGVAMLWGSLMPMGPDIPPHP